MHINYFPASRVTQALMANSKLYAIPSSMDFKHTMDLVRDLKWLADNGAGNGKLPSDVDFDVVLLTSIRCMKWICNHQVLFDMWSPTKYKSLIIEGYLGKLGELHVVTDAYATHENKFAPEYGFATFTITKDELVSHMLAPTRPMGLE